jgi:hypothetical protein
MPDDTPNTSPPPPPEPPVTINTDLREGGQGRETREVRSTEQK